MLEHSSPHPCSHPDLQLPTVIPAASHMRSLWQTRPSWISPGSSGAAARSQCQAKGSRAAQPGPRWP